MIFINVQLKEINVQLMEINVQLMEINVLNNTSAKRDVNNKLCESSVKDKNKELLKTKNDEET